MIVLPDPVEENFSSASLFQLRLSNTWSIEKSGLSHLPDLINLTLRQE